MRVLIDARPLMESRRGGVGMYAERMIGALTAAPIHRYSLYANAWRGTERPAGMPDGSDFRLTRLPNKALNAAFAFTHRPTLEALADVGAEAVWLPNLNFAATDLPLVVTAHDLSFERYPEFFSAKRRLWHRMVQPRRLFRQAAAIVAVSEHTKTDLVETYGENPKKIHVIPPGVGREFSPSAALDVPRVCERYRLPERYVLSLATLEPRKNFLGLIDAFGRAKTDATLVIAGGGGWLYRDIYRSAAESPAKDRIVFLGYVDEADKPALYAGAAAFAYPSFYEGFGLPVVEAMACGTPVVASYATSLAEAVGDAGILVDPRDINDIAAGIEAAMEESATARFRERGIARSARYDWNASARKLESVFSGLHEACPALREGRGPR